MYQYLNGPAAYIDDYSPVTKEAAIIDLIMIGCIGVSSAIQLLFSSI